MGKQLVLAATLLLLGGISPANAAGHNGHLTVGDLFVHCFRGGGPSSASFVTTHGHFALNLSAQSSVQGEGGEAGALVNNIDGVRFHDIEILKTGVCEDSDGFFEVFIGWSPQGDLSSTFGTSYRCRTMEVNGNPDHLLITARTVPHNGDGPVPDGAVLREINLNAQGAAPTPVNAFIYSVAVNHHLVPFETHSPGAFCSPD